MLRYVIAIARGWPIEPAPPLSDLPIGQAWTCVHASGQACIWIAWPSDSPLTGGPLRDGYRLGMCAGHAPAYADLAASWGAYVALRDDPASGEAAVLRDPSGRVPAYRARTAELEVVCSHVEDLRGYACEGLEIDWSYLAFLLLDESAPARRTGFMGVQEILPGEEITFSRGQVTSRLSWEPSAFYGDPITSTEPAKAAFRKAAETSVETWARLYGTATLDLSGGLDSSIVLGLLAKAPVRPAITCLNATVGHEESDERPFARAAAAMHGAGLLELDLGDEIPDYATAEPQPLQPRPTTRLLDVGFGRPALAAAKSAGAHAYLTGRGGDHVFFDGVPACAAADYLRTTSDPLGWLRASYDAARVAGVPMISVLREVFDRPSAAERLRAAMAAENPLVAPQAAAAVDVTAFAHPWVRRAAEDAPPAKLLQVTYFVELQRHHDRIGRAAVLDEVHPFISQPMIETGLRVGAWLFGTGYRRRGLQREVFRDLLPAEIYARRTKGATTSRTVRVFDRNLAYLRGLLLDGELAARGLLQRKALEARLSPAALYEGRAHAPLVRCVITQMWLNQAEAFLAGVKAFQARPGPSPGPTVLARSAPAAAASARTAADRADRPPPPPEARI